MSELSKSLQSLGLSNINNESQKESNTESSTTIVEPNQTKSSNTHVSTHSSTHILTEVKDGLQELPYIRPDLRINNKTFYCEDDLNYRLDNFLTSYNRANKFADRFQPLSFTLLTKHLLNEFLKNRGY